MADIKSSRTNCWAKVVWQIIYENDAWKTCAVTLTLQVKAWNEIPYSRGSQILRIIWTAKYSLPILRESESIGLRATVIFTRPSSDCDAETLDLLVWRGMGSGSVCLWISYYILSACFFFHKMELFRESKRERHKSTLNSSNSAVQTTHLGITYPRKFQIWFSCSLPILQMGR